MIKLGETGIGKMYLGDTEISKAYLGESLVYDASGGGSPYTSLSYVKFTGSQYIIIDYQPSPNSKIEMDIQFVENANKSSASANNAWLGTCDDSSEGVFYSNFGSTATAYKEIYYWFQKPYVANIWKGTYSDVFVRGDWVYYNNKVSFLGVNTTTQTKNITQTGKLVIGANNDLTKNFNRHDLIVYRIKLYTSNVLLHDLVPKTDGTHIGLYDEVTGDFIYSETGTELVTS